MGLRLKLFTLTFLLSMAFSETRGPGPIEKLFKGPFDESNLDEFEVLKPASINNGALQVTPDSGGNYNLYNKSGRIMLKDSFKLHDKGARVASFNTSFFINIQNLSSSTSDHGEGMAFVIAPNLSLPHGSEGQYLGLTNAITDGNPTNHLVAIEFDTFKQYFDPDDNHIGLNINSVISKQNVSLSDFGFQLVPEGPKNFTIWIEYDGVNKTLQVFLVDEENPVPTKPKPRDPVMIADLDIGQFVSERSYFGFAASTGSAIELHCVLGWNLTVEKLPEDEGLMIEAKIALGVGVPLLVILLACWWLQPILYKKYKTANDPTIMGTLKSLPGTPREFQFGDLKAATDNFNEKNKLGQGGFGVVYKGVLSKESLEIAVKRFSRDNVKSKDDFLAELTIINRLRHKHLVKLLGKATRESDIYGFGAVVLEVVCGQRPWTKIGGFCFLVDWVWSLHREGRILEAVDERLRGDYVAEEAERLLLLGLACSHPNASERPKTQAILQIASGSLQVPYVPPFRPAFVWPSAGAVEGNIDSEYRDDLTVTISH
ncbi:hypothetical protein NL676_006531 [Syzygium grande]|nr:hypothetical protein NL676_006531 [Syzygium grande]